MSAIYMEDKTFNKIDFTQNPLAKGDYENCTFIQCNFESTDLSGFQFIDCAFNGCNLSLVKLNTTVFRDVKFRDCKMLGLHFEQCSEFGRSFSFSGCQLNHSSFYQLNLKKMVFKDCDLQETDFAEGDLTAIVFDNCNLAQAVFDHTNLEKADLRSAYHYSINPEANKIKKAKFSVNGIAGLLDQYDIEIEQ